MSEFDRIIGYRGIKTELMMVCDVLKHRKKYEKLGVEVPSGILLYGDPGLGKTLFAQCFIAESGCRSFTLRKEKPNGDFINEIKAVFEKAKKEAPAIVFLDDMDKFANEDNYHRDAEEYVTVQSCIDDCKGQGIFVIATANNKYCMPDSLIRAGRFDKAIELNNPTGKDAEMIIEHFLKGKNTADNLDIEEITRLLNGNTCAELETIINEAGIFAGYEGRKTIGQQDIIRACIRQIYGFDIDQEEEDDNDLLKKAVHEAGHVVVGEILDPGSVSIVSINGGEEERGGVVRVKRPDGYAHSTELHEHEVMVHLGGKAATEVIFGEDDAGCNKDLESAFDKAAWLVDNICSHGFDAFESHCSSQYLYENRDRLIAAEISRMYKQAKKIIIENREFLDIVKEALVSQRILTFKDIRSIKDNLYMVA